MSEINNNELWSILPIRVCNGLKNIGVETLEQAAEINQRRFLSERNLGKGSWWDLQRVLKENGYIDGVSPVKMDAKIKKLEEGQKIAIDQHARFLAKIEERIDVGFENMMTRVLDKIENKNETIERYLDDSNKNYKKFIEVLNGSELMRFLSEINRMAMKLDSHNVNMRSTLDIAQKFISNDYDMPQTKLDKMLGELDMRIHQVKELFVSFDELEKGFRDSINYKERILKNQQGGLSEKDINSNDDDGGKSKLCNGIFHRIKNVCQRSDS